MAQGGVSIADYSGVPASLTFAAGDTEKTITFSATADRLDDDDESVKLTFGTLPAGVSAGTPNETTVTITDDDDPAVTVSFGKATYAVDEGSTVAVRVTLSYDPERSVTIPLTKVAQGGVSIADYSGVPASLTFAAGDTEKTITFSATADRLDDDDESVKLTFGTLPAGVSAGTPNETTVTITDDDDPAVTVSFGKATYAVDEGSTVAVRVTLSYDPERSVTIPLTKVAQGGVSIADYSGVPASLTFAAGDTEKTITFSATADRLDDDDESVKLTFGTLPAGVSAGTPNETTVTITDDDTRGVTVMPTALTIDEGGADAYTVVLDTQPVGDVTITPSSDNPEVVLLPVTLTFTDTDWNREKTVTVRAAEDSDATDDSARITHTVAGGDYQGVSVELVDVTVTDNGPAGRDISAWLARFGRTVMDQVIDAVSGRLAAPKSPGMEVSLAGRALPVWNRQGVADEYGSSEDAPASAATPGDAVAGGLRASLASPAERGASDALRSWISHTGVGDDDVPGGIPGAQSLAVQSWSPTARDLRSGTSFALTGEPGADGGMLSFWGRGSLNRFDGREDDLALDGEATTWLVGADRSRQSHTVGAMLGHSQVVGGYRSSADNGEAESGEIEATLTGVYPYTGLVVHERLSVWAVAGYGTGDLTLKPEGGGSVETGLSLTMAAAGVRSEALRAPEASGLSLAVKGDVRVTRVSSDAAGDAVAGRLLVANAEVWRARAGVEGARSFALDEKGGVVTPSFEVGARFDGGDAETGFGVDIGGGVALDDPGRGVTAALKARGLVAHEDQDLREWGVSAAFAWDPRPQTEQGLSLSLMQSWGASSSGGMEALLSRDTLVGLAANDESPVGRRLEVELGYGLAVFGGDFTVAPNAGVALTESGRDWRLGWRLTPAWSDASGFEVNLDVVRNEVDGEAPEHAVTLRGGIRF